MNDGCDSQLSIEVIAMRDAEFLEYFKQNRDSFLPKGEEDGVLNSYLVRLTDETRKFYRDLSHEISTTYLLSALKVLFELSNNFLHFLFTFSIYRPKPTKFCLFNFLHIYLIDFACIFHKYSKQQQIAMYQTCTSRPASHEFVDVETQTF